MREVRSGKRTVLFARRTVRFAKWESPPGRGRFAPRNGRSASESEPPAPARARSASRRGRPGHRGEPPLREANRPLPDADDAQTDPGAREAGGNRPFRKAGGAEPEAVIPLSRADRPRAGGAHARSGTGARGWLFTSETSAPTPRTPPETFPDTPASWHPSAFPPRRTSGAPGRRGSRAGACSRSW